MVCADFPGASMNLFDLALPLVYRLRAVGVVIGVYIAVQFKIGLQMVQNSELRPPANTKVPALQRGINYSIARSTSI